MGDHADAVDQPRMPEETPTHHTPEAAAHESAVPTIVAADTEEIAAQPSSPVVAAPKSPLGSRLAKQGAQASEELEPLVGMLRVAGCDEAGCVRAFEVAVCYHLALVVWKYLYKFHECHVAPVLL